MSDDGYDGGGGDGYDYEGGPGYTLLLLNFSDWAELVTRI